MLLIDFDPSPIETERSGINSFLLRTTSSLKSDIGIFHVSPIGVSTLTFNGSYQQYSVSSQ